MRSVARGTTRGTYLPFIILVVLLTELWDFGNITLKLWTLVRYLSTLSFPGESYKAVDRTLDQAETLLQKLEVLLDKLLTTERRSFTLEQFLAEIIQEESLLPDLWVR